MTLKVMTWLWRQTGGRGVFGPQHVNIWADMIRRHCTLDIQLACITDLADGIDPTIEIIEPPQFHQGLQTTKWRGGRPSCYRRISLWAPDAADWIGAERFVSMDLDVVISRNIDRIWSRSEDVVLNSPSSLGRRWIYNGSMLMMTAGARPHVYEEFTPQAADVASRQFVGSDQAWLAHTLGPGEAVWSKADGVYRWGREVEKVPMLFFPGAINPWQALGNEWVSEHYRAEGPAEVLILADSWHVWEDYAEVKGREFDKVIAMPRACTKFSGYVHEVAESMAHAHLLAKMYGCAEPVVCGAPR